MSNKSDACGLQSRVIGSVALVTCPKTRTEYRTRIVMFYGNTAKAFYDYHRDLCDLPPAVLDKQAEREMRNA